MLAVHDLVVTYRKGGEPLFDGLSHHFSDASITAVTGPSGRGKSTLLYVLGLLLRPTRGRVLLDGVAVDQARDATRSRLRATTFGFIFQDASLDASRTIEDGVVEPALYAGSRRAEVLPVARRLLTELGVVARADHLPGEISGGQAQRVAVCRALVNDPRVILADEPTGNLDRDNARIVLDALRGATSSGRTVVVATHDPFVLDYADEVLRL